MNNWLNNNKAIAYLLLFLLVFIFFSWVESSPVFSDPDSFYHAKVTQLISEEGVIRDFPYLQFTTLREGYVDHHLLYHLYLVPFVKIFPMAVGVKIGHVFLVTLFFILMYFLLNQLRVKGAFWYVLLLLFVEPFVFRIGLVKAQPLSLIFLFLGIFLILRRKYILLFLLSWFYVWSYGGWFLMLIMALIYVFIESLDIGFAKSHESLWSRVTYFNKKKLLFVDNIYNFSIAFLKNVFRFKNIKLVGSVFLGLTAGLIINPYFPKNLEFYYIHIIKIAFVNYQSVIGVGSEWYPYSVNDFLVNGMLPLALGGVALLILFGYRQKFNVVAKYFLVLFLSFVLATIKSRRNIEYMSPIAIIFAAVVFSQAMESREIRNDLKAFVKSFKRVFFNDRYVKIVLILFLFFMFCLAFYKMPYHARQSLGRGYNYNYLKSASEYLKDNSNEGDIVLHSDWDEFPILFYHNSKNYYIVGLDATFMYLYDSELYAKWVDVTQGRRYKDLYEIVKNDFEAKYILATTDHENMIRSFDNNFYFDKVYSDDEAVIYKVL